MVRDGETSVKRSLAGKVGGEKTKEKIFGNNHFAQAKSEAKAKQNTEYENEYDNAIVIDIDNTLSKKRKVLTKPKSSEDGLLFANWFAQKYWTHHLEATDQIKNGWGVTYDILIKRGNTKTVIVKIIEWAKADSFWSKQFLSPNKLLDKKHGADMNHFDYFAIQIKTTRDKSNNVISDQVMNNVVEAIKLNQNQTK